MQHATTHNERLGLALGLLGVVIFALTLPMTRLATGTPEAPQLSGLFIAMGRAAVAGALSALWLLYTRASWPARADWPALLLVAAGVVFGFPLFTSLAMRHVEAVHASVMLGVLPLATALVGARLQRQRPSTGFWALAIAGTALVVLYAIVHSGGLTLSAADVLLLLAMACAAVGYAWGARLAQRLGAAQVICWALLISLPLSLPLSWLAWPATSAHAAAWGAFGYVAVCSMWLGFFAWYRGLALGGTVRVSQVQLLQPFLSMLFAVPLLGETLDVLTLGCGLAVAAVVYAARRLPIASAR